jgi:hypothetical protein
LGLISRFPDHTTLSRRGRTFANRRPQVVPHGPLHLLLDSTGLKLCEKGEWNNEKHGRARRSWRKLHLAVDADTGEIVASVLTSKEAGDAGQVPVLLEQVEGEIASVMADGAYDGEPVYRPSKHASPRHPRALSSRPAAQPFSALRPTRTRASETVTSASSRSKAVQRGAKQRDTDGGAWLRRRSAATRP